MGWIRAPTSSLVGAPRGLSVDSGGMVQIARKKKNFHQMAGTVEPKPEMGILRAVLLQFDPLSIGKPFWMFQKVESGHPKQKGIPL